MSTTPTPRVQLSVDTAVNRDPSNSPVSPFPAPLSRHDTSHDTSHAHFVKDAGWDILKHRPHKTLFHWARALGATALARIWPILLFTGGWSTMVVLVNLKTSVPFHFPNTMITVLGVLLGLTLSYRTSSAYEKYSEGRRQWANITHASRTWARTVWFHSQGPDSCVPVPPEDPDERAKDEAKAVLEKKTSVRMALGFAVAMKHYLRGEEGVHYSDLYPLVSFIPSLGLPSGMAGADATLGQLPSLSAHDHGQHHHVELQRAENVPRFRFSDTWIARWVRRVFRPRKEAARRAQKRQSSADELDDAELGELGAQVGRQNIPLEVTVYMSMYLAALQRRKTLDVPTTNMLFGAINQLTDALANLERILTTPIPWSFNAHIWEVSWIYCLALPFQLYASNFKWITVPATVVTTYIVMGYASIAEEIENPFGYDKNDLNLGYFCREIIAKELDAITSTPFRDPSDWMFSTLNRPLGVWQPNAVKLADTSISELRGRLARGSVSWVPPSRKESLVSEPASIA
ncbi:UPF0187 protein [Vanrija pseudolonga]|uniref:UPF0187 protein n=1 Tax=Vanrija pseudolonga TaxID=143232 RepID=A0AAF0YAG4_9TREE|nr:UPF0187 protein [Vanrija pseudolonga]